MQAIIEQKLKQLPPNLYGEVINFIDSLIREKVSRRKKRPKLDWIGGLKEYRDQYTSIELQKKALEWRE